MSRQGRNVKLGEKIEETGVERWGKGKDGVQATFAIGAAVIVAHLSGVARFLACEKGG